MSVEAKLERLEAKVDRLTAMVCDLALPLVKHQMSVPANDVCPGDTLLVDDVWSEVVGVQPRPDGKILFLLVSTRYGCKYQADREFNADAIVEIKRKGVPPH